MLALTDLHHGNNKYFSIFYFKYMVDNTIEILKTKDHNYLSILVKNMTLLQFLLIFIIKILKMAIHHYYQFQLLKNVPNIILILVSRLK